jgi:formylglycine-generating enzyme required for sulfatase activity
LHTCDKEEAAVKPLRKRFITFVLFWGLACPGFDALELPCANPVVGRPAAGETIAGKVSKSGGPRPEERESAAFLQAAGPANSQPLTQQQLLELITAHVPLQRIAELLHDRGVDFQVEEAYIASLRRAGATEAVIAALRNASAMKAGVLVETSPNAQVFLDGNLQGQADAQGVLSFRAKLGAHTVKVSLAGKQDFQQSVDLTEKQHLRLVATLADLAGSVRVQAPGGTGVWLDNSLRGAAGADGELLLAGVAPGTHLLRVTAPGKVDDVRSITVTAGAETLVAATLADRVQVNSRDGLKYVWIAAGTFTMGCSPGDNDCAAPEKPAHPVTLAKAYWLGQTEVTAGAYKLYVQAANAPMPQAPKMDRGWKNASLPMVNVNWQEANQYCAWAGGRLPTEAEWEYAARGGNSQARYGNLNDIAWTRDNTRQARPVATRQPNVYGLYDMLGNVWEWVNDWFDPNSYQSGAVQDPTGPAAGAEKVLRGGSWIVDPKLLRASDRYSIKPDAPSDYFGFRCVWTPKTP